METGNVWKGSQSQFQVKGDDKATQLFEFMANPGETTNVEWSQVKVGTAESQKNIVGNMHQEGETAVGQYVFRTGYTVRENNHSHTNGITTLSLGDVTTAGMINGTFPNAPTKIYTNPSQYSPFNKNSEYRIIGLPLLFFTLFISFGLKVSAQADTNKTTREYLHEIQVDSAFFSMLDNVLAAESHESYYRKDFNYGITFFADQHGNNCIQIEAIGRRVLKNGIEFGVMTYKGYAFIFYGKKNDKVIKLQREKFLSILP